MKTKITLFFAILSIALFSSCSKEDDLKKSLAGEYYSGYAYSGNSSIFGNSSGDYDAYWSYRFIDDSNAERTANKNSEYGSIIGDPEIYTYTYNYPNISFEKPDGTILTGTFQSEDLFRIGDINYKRQ